MDRFTIHNISEHCGDTSEIKIEKQGLEHVSEYFEAFFQMLLAMSFQEGSIEKYVRDMVSELDEGASVSDFAWA